jgi:hypothetical protein
MVQSAIGDSATRRPPPATPLSIPRFCDEIRRDYLRKGRKRDALSRLEKVRGRLVEIGVRTVDDLAAMDNDDLKRFLDGEGNRDNLHRALQAVYTVGVKLCLLTSGQKFSKATYPLGARPEAPTLDDVRRLLGHQCEAAAESWKD